MAADKIKLPPGFELDAPPVEVTAPRLPEGFVLDEPQSGGPMQRVGEFATGVNEGIANLLGLPVDVATNILNLGIAAYGSARTAMGKPGAAPDLIENPVGGSSQIKDAFSRAGLMPRQGPTDAPGRIIRRVGNEVGATAVPTARVGRVGTVAGETALSVASGSAAGAGAEFGGKPGEALGQASVLLGPKATAAAVRGVTRGDNANVVKENIDSFAAAGTTPTVGQATGRRYLQGTENLLGRVPGGPGPIFSRARSQADEMGEGVANVRESVSPRYGPEQAGRTIKGGISAFTSRFTSKAEQLYDDASNFVPKDMQVQASNVTRVLDEVTTPIQGAENTSGTLINPKLAKLKEQLQADMTANNGTLPYEALKKLRSAIGRQMNSGDLVTDLPKAELKRLYGALSEDMRLAAQQAGPEALAAFERANTYYKAGTQRIDDTLQAISNKVDPEDAYQAVVSGTKEGASTLRKVKRSLTPEEWDVVQATVIDRLGRATPGRQDEVGDVFSPATFLTNWNGLSKAAKLEMFPNGRIRSDLDHIAKTSARIKEAAGVGANPSGTAGAAANIGAVGGAVALLATGQWWALGGLVSTVAGANVTARVMTSPKAVKWLAESTLVSPKQAQEHVKRLYMTMQNSSPEEREALEELYSSVSNLGR